MPRVNSPPIKALPRLSAVTVTTTIVTMPGGTLPLTEYQRSLDDSSNDDEPKARTPVMSSVELPHPLAAATAACRDIDRHYKG
jgi:hypothetical protein